MHRQIETPQVVRKNQLCGWHQTVCQKWKRIENLNTGSEDRGMEFGIQKYAILRMKRGKQQMTEGIVCSGRRKFTNTWEYWKRTPSNMRRWKRDFFKRIPQENEKNIRNQINLIKGINTMAVPLVRYSGLFLKCTREELQQMDQRIRKLMTIHKAFHPRYDVNRLYVKKRWKRTSQLARQSRCIDTTTRRRYK